jgi:hypothetical protein
MKVRLGSMSARAVTVWMAIAVVAGSPAMGAGGDLLWEDISGTSTFDQAFAVAASGATIFTAGWAGYPDPGNPNDVRDFLVRAQDAETGALLWQDQVSIGDNDYAASVAVEGDRVLVAGVGGSFENVDWILRAYDAATGGLLWDAAFDRAGGLDAPRPDAIAVSGGRLFVAGMADYYSVWIVRAYDTTTGALVWHDETMGPGWAAAEAVVVAEDRVFVGGPQGTDVSANAHLTAYDAATGALLWESRLVAPFSNFTTSRGLGSDGKRVFAGAAVANASGKTDFVVVANDAATGALLWQDRWDTGGEIDGAYGIAVQGRRVFASGVGGPACLLIVPAPPSDCNLLLRGYDGPTGALLWEKETGVPKADELVPHVVAKDGRVFLQAGVGVKGKGPRVFGGDWWVEAYDGRTGNVLWRDLRDAGGGIEVPLDAVVLDDRLFVVGRTAAVPFGSDFAVRAYSVGGSAP